MYESATNVHLVLERVDGGELFDFIRNAGQLTEPQAALVIRGILTGLSILHDQQIVHRDLKPENIMFKDSSKLDSIKIVDFGLSATCKKGKLHIKCGSPGYVAPEMLNDEGYDCKADVFSAGVILYIM